MDGYANTVAPTAINGINLDDLFALIEGVRTDPAKGKTHWPVATTWQGQTPSRAEVEGFGIAGNEVAREATANDDRIAAENFYQHAEHYFRVDNARREGNQQGTPPRATTPADVEMNPDADSREVDVDRFQSRWDGEDSVSSEPSTH